MSNLLLDPMTSICIYEFIYESANKIDYPEVGMQEFWAIQFEEKGAYGVRDLAINLSTKIDEAWFLFKDVELNESFDYNFIPRLMTEAFKRDERWFLSWAEVKWVELAKELYAEKLGANS